MGTPTDPAHLELMLAFPNTGTFLFLGPVSAGPLGSSEIGLPPRTIYLKGTRSPSRMHSSAKHEGRDPVQVAVFPSHRGRSV